MINRTDNANRRPPAHRRCFLACVLTILGTACCAWAPPSRAAQSDGFISREYPLKALFLCNFGGYVEWPASAFESDEQPFVIAILGESPIDTMLRQIAATKSVAGRRIVIKHFDSVDVIEPCHVLFVPRTVSEGQRQEVVERLRGLPVLVVGESHGFAARGGCVNFYIESNKIRFKINLDAARLQRLRISAKLLALAKIVQ